MHVKFFPAISLDSLELIFTCTFCSFLISRTYVQVFNILGFRPKFKFCGGCHHSLGMRGRVCQGESQFTLFLHSLDYSDINSYFILCLITLL